MSAPDPARARLDNLATDDYRAEMVQAALQAVLDLHKPFPAKYHPSVWPRPEDVGVLHCEHCVNNSVSHTLYPCETVQAIAEKLGVDL